MNRNTSDIQAAPVRVRLCVLAGGVIFAQSSVEGRAVSPYVRVTPSVDRHLASAVALLCGIAKAPRVAGVLS